MRNQSRCPICTFPGGRIRRVFSIKNSYNGAVRCRTCKNTRVVPEVIWAAFRLGGHTAARELAESARG